MIVAFRSEKVRLTNAPFTEQKATIFRPSRIKSQLLRIVILARERRGALHN